jgi:preprotein translocase subunit YajC
MLTATLLLAAEGGDPLGGLGAFLPIILIVLLGYFMIFRPMRRQEAERRAMVNSLKKNDEVVAVGGILGTVVNIKEKVPGTPSGEDEVTVKIDDKVRIRVLRGAISRVAHSPAPSDAAKQDVAPTSTTR